MDIYELEYDSEHYLSLNFQSTSDTELFHRYWLQQRDGEIVTSLPPLATKRSRHGARGKRWTSLVNGDTAYLTHGMLALNQRAVAALGDLLKGHGVFFPLISNEFEYTVFFVTNVVDALDYERSSFERFASSGRISEVVEYALFANRLHRQNIFCLKDIVPEVFVTKEFVDRVKNEKLTGFDFPCIWSSSE
jgi:hypothetical protein